MTRKSHLMTMLAALMALCILSIGCSDDTLTIYSSPDDSSQTLTTGDPGSDEEIVGGEIAPPEPKYDSTEVFQDNNTDKTGDQPEPWYPDNPKNENQGRSEF